MGPPKKCNCVVVDDDNDDLASMIVDNEDDIVGIDVVNACVDCGEGERRQSPKRTERIQTNKDFILLIYGIRICKTSDE
jgi:hypothetical protein